MRVRVMRKTMCTGLTIRIEHQMRRIASTASNESFDKSGGAIQVTEHCNDAQLIRLP